ncbi:hypothetical protein HOS55_gp010 [Pseudomonas phage PMBT3]|uniref:Uncharacterized protein n=1 Tax=Pseudomonas phage PMBT3 TaxID=2059856 RepID=A0A2I6PHT7_9CAUD|nr:hypothetical protein HOS55_gp010 [Pseudomonas phage PMBT3]AUM59612.1 hypothetical protein [Pseudomonas phage PMBT3]
MTDFMLGSLTELDTRFRNWLRTKVTPDMLYGYDFTEGLDVSANDAGVLLEQNNDFWLFELSIQDVGRAGPSQVAPRRVEASLDVSLFTKSPRDKVKYGRKVDTVAEWFQDRTIDGMRFRTFTPVPPAPLHGFTAYGGVTNIMFEIYVQRS